MENLSNTINQLNIIVIYRIHHSTITEYKFFSKAQGKSTNTDVFWAMQQTSTNLKELKSYKASFLNGIKLEISKKKKNVENPQIY